MIARGRAGKRSEVNLPKAPAVVIGIVAIVLGYVFENQNVAFMVGLAFTVAASCNRGHGGAAEGGLGADFRLPAGAVPLRQPGAGLDDHRLSRHLAGVAPMRRVLPDPLRLIGGRPLVGYYIDFNVRMLDKYALDLLQTKLPNPRIEVSSLDYGRGYGDAPPGTSFDLSFAVSCATCASRRWRSTTRSTTR